MTTITVKAAIVAVRQHAGDKVEMFSFPNGAAARAFAREVRALGFEAIVSVVRASR